MILAALLDNAGYTFGDDEYGDLAVKATCQQRLSVVYLIRAGGEAGETANHFRAQAATLADATTPFPDDLSRPDEATGECR
jgi:hypothetical protein